MFTVDILHEVPIGVFKAIFKYLADILGCYSGDLVATINERYKISC